MLDPDPVDLGGGTAELDQCLGEGNLAQAALVLLLRSDHQPVEGRRHRGLEIGAAEGGGDFGGPGRHQVGDLGGQALGQLATDPLLVFLVSEPAQGVELALETALFLETAAHASGSTRWWAFRASINFRW